MRARVREPGAPVLPWMQLGPGAHSGLTMLVWAFALACSPLSSPIRAPSLMLRRRRCACASRSRTSTLPLCDGHGEAVWARCSRAAAAAVACVRACRLFDGATSARAIYDNCGVLLTDGSVCTCARDAAAARVSAPPHPPSASDLVTARRAVSPQCCLALPPTPRATSCSLTLAPS